VQCRPDGRRGAQQRYHYRAECRRLPGNSVGQSSAQPPAGQIRRLHHCYADRDQDHGKSKAEHHNQSYSRKDAARCGRRKEQSKRGRTGHHSPRYAQRDQASQSKSVTWQRRVGMLPAAVRVPPRAVPVMMLGRVLIVAMAGYVIRMIVTGRIFGQPVVVMARSSQDSVGVPIDTVRVLND
jgi:hypothetical protein